MAEETQPLQPQQAPPNQPQQAPPQNAIMAVGGNLKNAALNVLKERKPWSEMVDRSSFARPANLAEATGRLRKNANYFKVNYLVVIVTITAATMALYPTSLIVLGLLALAWLYLFVVRSSPLVIGGRTFNDNEKFIGMAVISGVIIFFLTSVGTVLFTALGISCAAIGLHGAFRQPDDLFTDEAEHSTGVDVLPCGDSSAHSLPACNKLNGHKSVTSLQVHGHVYSSDSLNSLALAPPVSVQLSLLQSQQGGIFGLFGGAGHSNAGHNIV